LVIDPVREANVFYLFVVSWPRPKSEAIERVMILLWKRQVLTKSGVSWRIRWSLMFLGFFVEAQRKELAERRTKTKAVNKQGRNACLTMIQTKGEDFSRPAL
jgi:hypothetical protein